MKKPNCQNKNGMKTKNISVISSSADCKAQILTSTVLHLCIDGIYVFP